MRGLCGAIITAGALIGLEDLPAKISQVESPRQSRPLWSDSSVSGLRTFAEVEREIAALDGFARK